MSRAARSRSERRTHAPRPLVAHAHPPYDHLPEPIALEDTIATQDSEPAPDPNAGRNPERDFMLRYGGV